jgi:hypothetical protein
MINMRFYGIGNARREPVTSQELNSVQISPGDYLMTMDGLRAGHKEIRIHQS